MLWSRRRLFRYWQRATAAYLLLTLLATVLIDYLPTFALPAALERADDVLWVTAHPDDESFFFAPAILNLLQRKPRRGALLCLSTGDHEGRGPERVDELKASCERLGIAPDRCVAINVPSLQDEPETWWEASDVQAEVERWLTTWRPDAILTFDTYGVSGHANHRAIGAAMRDAAQTGRYPPIYAVQSTNVLAKFTSVLLLPYVVVSHTLLASNRDETAIFVSSLRQYRAALASFHAHQSQARWFRTLFIYFSRYLWYVTATRVA
ncbi:hypothetical protein JCM3774_006271 [Rhodotorula dairenensis]